MRRASSLRLVVALLAAGSLAACGGGGASESAPAPWPLTVVASPGQATLSWSPYPGAVGYTLYWASAPGVTAESYSTLPSGHAVPGIAASPYTATGLPDGALVWLRVVPNLASGTGTPSREAAAVMAPTAPSLIESHPFLLGLRLDWTDARLADAYRVYVATSPGVTPQNYASLPNGRRLDVLRSPILEANLNPRLTYYYVVTGVNATGEGPPSAMLAARADARPWGGFADVQDIPVGGGDSVAADFDLDGRMDLAVVDPANASVTLLPGAGDGTFASGPTYPVGRGPTALVAAFVDGDTSLDLVTANRDDGTVSVLLGSGDGGFLPAYDLPVGTRPVALVATPFVNGGATDVAVALEGDDAVAVLRGHGDGTFDEPVTYAVGHLPGHLAAGRFDADASTDLLVLNEGDANLSLLRGTGDGTFAPQEVSPAGVDPSSLVATDFNADGILDVAIGDGDSGLVTVLTGTGDGSLVANVGSSTSGGGLAAVASGDFDADGNADVVVVNQATGQLSVCFGDGVGGFWQVLDLPAGTAPSSLRVGDFDGDGVLDLAISDPATGSLHILVGQS